MVDDINPNNLVDADSLLMLKELLGEKFIELVETYLKDSVVRIDNLKIALSTNNLEAAKHEVHGLKGSSRNIGVNGLADICEVLEKQTRDGQVTDQEQQLAAIEKNFAAVEIKLRTFL